MYLWLVNIICLVDFCVRYWVCNKRRNYGFAFGVNYLGKWNLWLHVLGFGLGLMLRRQERFMDAILIGSGYNLLNRIVSGCVIDYIYLFPLWFNLCDVVIVVNMGLLMCGLRG
ncbi:MAG: hypothetical protein Hyperionvirus13_3 [Hyperionvirus sp.]|uniref:Signal peptidase II n=1 Tax=Hyperionvirus sp. TaxID=2487770 RepID=A0A3G5AC68_9VIRU|nr:MAG: hypothetical protein Hyperionvirus13_3 [Hyperionvirus sp.]